MLVNRLFACVAQGRQTGRRADDRGSLLREFGKSAYLIDLDREQYFAEADLEAYALATLALVGDERAGNPYADSAVAEPVAPQLRPQIASYPGLT